MGTFLGCEGISRRDCSKSIKVLLNIDTQVKQLDHIELSTNKGIWIIKPSFYYGFIDEKTSSLRLARNPLTVIKQSFDLIQAQMLTSNSIWKWVAL